MVRIFLSGAALVLVFTAASAPAWAQLILFQEDNYRGNQLVVDRDIANLTEFRFNDRVSSLRVIGGGAWRLCEHDYGQGRCVTVTHDEPKMDRLGMDDVITSVRQDDGWARDRRDDRRRYREERRRERDWERR